MIGDVMSWVFMVLGYLWLGFFGGAACLLAIGLLVASPFLMFAIVATWWEEYVS